MRAKRYKTFLFIAIVIICAVVGMDVQKREKQYKSFFIERNEANAVEAPVIENEPSEIEEELMININTANVFELQLLEGIGEKTAERIIDYRNENGNFEVIEDLMRIDGIGKKKFDAVKENICVE